MKTARTISVVGLVLMAVSTMAWTASLWVVSYRSSGGGGSDLTVALTHGELMATSEATYFGHGFEVIRSGPRLVNLQLWPERFWSRSTRVGVGGGVGGVDWSLHLPLWIPFAAGLFVAIAGVAASALTRRGRVLAGLCIGCGYERSGLNAAAACPECGGRAS